MPTTLIDAARAPEKPAPPSEEMLEALWPRPCAGTARASADGPLLCFEFKKRYSNLQKTTACKFVLRNEHVEEFVRLHTEFNWHRPEGCFPMNMSDIVAAALDFAFEHPISFKGLAEPSQARQAIARAVYRRAFLHFLSIYENL